MNRTIALGFLLLLTAFAAHPVYADDVKPADHTKVLIDIADPDLGDQTRNAVVGYLADKAKKTVKDEITTPTPDKMEKWAKIGKGIGDAVAAAAHSLNVGVNDFIKTPAGQLTVWVIFLYLFGHSLWTVVAGIVIWLVGGSLIYFSFRKFHMPRKLKDKDGNERLEGYRWDSKDAKVVSVCFHVGFFALLSFLCIIEIL